MSLPSQEMVENGAYKYLHRYLFCYNLLQLHKYLINIFNVVIVKNLSAEQFKCCFVKISAANKCIVYCIVLYIMYTCIYVYVYICLCIYVYAYKI